MINILSIKKEIPECFFSITYSFISILYVFALGSVLKPLIYVFINRVTYSLVFSNKYIFTNDIDSAIIFFGSILFFVYYIRFNRVTKYICLASSFILYLLLPLSFSKFVSLIIFPAITFFLIYYNKKLGENTKIYIKLDYFSIPWLFLSINSIFLSSQKILLGTVIIPITNYLYQIYSLLTITTPFLLISLSFTGPIKLLYLIKHKAQIENNSTNVQSKISKKIKYLLLFLILILSIIITAIPHFSTINTNKQMLGDDSKDYERFLKPIVKSNSFQEIIFQSFIVQSKGDRPISLLVIYGLTQLFPNVDILYVIDSLPMLLIPILTITIFFLTLQITKNEVIAIISALLTPVSFHSLIGIYGGFYANLIALIFGYTSIIFLLRYIHHYSKSSFIIFALLIILLLFAHAVTWTIIIMSLTIFIILLIITKKDKRKEICFLLFVIVFSLIIDEGKQYYIGLSGFYQDMQFGYAQGVGLGQIPQLWSNIMDTTNIYLGGQFNNFLIYGLVLFWLLGSKSIQLGNILILIFISLFLISLLFGNSEIQGRVLYNIPLQIPASISLITIKDKKKKLIFFSIISIIFAISIRSLTNYPFFSNTNI